MMTNFFLLLTSLALSWSSPAPQYGGDTEELTAANEETIKDIFGIGGTGGYSERQTAKLEEDAGGVTAIVQIVTNEAGYEAPDDYQKGELTEKVTSSHVDNLYEFCYNYTETQGYQCVPYYQCGDDGEIITDGGGLIDVRNGFGILSPEDSKCPGYLDVCCKDPDFVAPPPPPIVKHIPKCGQRHQNGLGARIQGFKEHQSQFGEWPHMCAILAEKPETQEDGTVKTVNEYKCGGSLIHPGVILTAAHCVEKLKNVIGTMKVRCGEWDTQTTHEPRPHEDIYVEAMDIHPEFRKTNLANDWALLFLQQDFQLQAHIDTICMPDPKEVFDGQTCFATGWGKDLFGKAGQFQVVLKEIDLPVVSNYDCQAAYRKSRVGKLFKLDKSFMCAGGPGKDACTGDGGGPLVCAKKYDHTSYVQAGIVAWGVGCGEYPGVYASVAEGACWIDYVMSCHLGRKGEGFSSQLQYTQDPCQQRHEDLLYRLQQAVDAGKYADSLKGRKKAQALAAAFAAQEALEKYNTCSIYWPLTNERNQENGGNYGGGGGDDEGLDLTGFVRNNEQQLPTTNNDSPQ